MGCTLAEVYFALSNASSASCQVPNRLGSWTGNYRTLLMFQKNSSKTQNPLYREGCMDDHLSDVVALSFCANTHIKSLPTKRQHWKMNVVKKGQKFLNYRHYTLMSPIWHPFMDLLSHNWASRMDVMLFPIKSHYGVRYRYLSWVLFMIE